MANVLKFVETFKDKTFDEVPLCEADIVVGSLFSYASFEKTKEFEKHSLKDRTCRASVFNKEKTLDIMSENYLNPNDFKKFLQPILSYKRYRNLQIGYIKNFFSEKQTMQFFTFTIFTKNYNVIFFRGTDVSILGRKENFNMLLEDKIPSQTAAKKYVKEISQLNKRPIIIVGHSKGGNLAYYAYFNSPKYVKDRVVAVYNFDGPSFFKEKYDYSEFNKKLFKFVPYDDVIGLVFEDTDLFIPISTKKRGIISHDLLTWNFSKKSEYKLLERKKSLTLTARAFQITLNIWLNKLSKSEAQELIDFILAIATCNQMKDLFALKLDIIKARKVYLDKIANYDQDTKDRLKLLSRDLVKTFFTVLLHSKDYKCNGEKAE